MADVEEKLAPEKAKCTTSSLLPFMHKDGGEPEYKWKLNAGLRDTRGEVGRLLSGVPLTFKGDRKQPKSLVGDFFVHRLPSAGITRGFHQRSESRAMGNVLGSRPEWWHSRGSLGMLQTTFYLMKGKTLHIHVLMALILPTIKHLHSSILHIF